jgi:hypothetical protein
MLKMMTRSKGIKVKSKDCDVGCCCMSDAGGLQSEGH